MRVKGLSKIRVYIWRKESKIKQEIKWSRELKGGTLMRNYR